VHRTGASIHPSIPLSSHTRPSTMPSSRKGQSVTPTPIQGRSLLRIPRSTRLPSRLADIFDAWRRRRRQSCKRAEGMRGISVTTATLTAGNKTPGGCCRWAPRWTDGMQIGRGQACGPFVATRRRLCKIQGLPGAHAPPPPPPSSMRATTYLLLLFLVPACLACVFHVGLPPSSSSF